jgi:hypothetical protein
VAAAACYRGGPRPPELATRRLALTTSQQALRARFRDPVSMTPHTAVALTTQSARPKDRVEIHQGASRSNARYQLADLGSGRLVLFQRKIGLRWTPVEEANATTPVSWTPILNIFKTMPDLRATIASGQWPSLRAGEVSPSPGTGPRAAAWPAAASLRSVGLPPRAGRGFGGLSCRYRYESGVREEVEGVDPQPSHRADPLYQPASACPG